MGKSPVAFPFIILEKYKPQYIMSPTVRSDTGIAKHRIYLEKSARRRTRSGGPRPVRTGAERRHRTFEPGIGLENKKERCFMHHSFLFISARRGSNPRPPPWQGGAPPLSHSRMSYGQVIIYYRVPEKSIRKVCIFFINCIYN